MVRLGIPTAEGLDRETPQVARVSQLFSDLVRVETLLWNLIDARLHRELDLTLGRYESMSVIGRRGRCRPLDIAQDLGITLSGTSKIVARIEAAGHCVRASNPSDGRSLFVELTDAGRTALDQATAIVEDELASRLGAALSARRIDALGGALDALRTSMYARSREQDSRP